MDSELHPDGFGRGVESENLVYVSRNVFRGAKQVDDVDALVDLRKVRAAGFVQHGGMLWIDGKDAISGLLHVLWNSKRILARMILDSDDRDGFRRP